MPGEALGLDSIFCEAIEIESADGRASFLDAVCDGDPGLRRLAEKLIAAHFRSGSFLEAPILG